MRRLRFLARYAMKRLIAILLLTGLALGVAAQTTSLPHARKRAVYGTDSYVAPSRYDYTLAARQIVADAASDYDKAERLYRWLCTNITYDHTGTVRTADATWERRTAVCQGYCELFYRLAESIGLRSRLVFGRCKHASRPTAEQQTPSFEDHTWLCIDTEDGEILADPTWDASMLRRKSQSSPLPSSHLPPPLLPLLWFDVDPAWFIFTHQPKSHHRQLLGSDVSDAQFVAMPYLTPHSALLGLSADAVLQRQLTDGGAPPYLVEANVEWLEQVNIVSLPATYRLPIGEPVTFVVDKMSDDILVQLVGDADSHGEAQWVHDGNRLTLTFTPQHPGRLFLAVTPRRGVPVLKRLVEYEVEG